MSKSEKSENAKRGNWFKRHKILTGLGVVIVLIIVIASTSSGSKSTNKSSSSSNSSSSSKKAETTAKIGDEAQSLDASSQYVFNASGQKYSYSSEATIYAAPDTSSSTWYNNINPGNSVTGDIIYDVPTSTMPTTAELHDSAFSGGVKVNLQ